VSASAADPAAGDTSSAPMSENLDLVHSINAAWERRKTSGLELGQMRTRGSCLWHVHGGKVNRLVVHRTADRALADLGQEA
jgi:hypothetical protein